MKRKRTIRHKKTGFLQTIKILLLIFIIVFLCMCIPIGIKDILTNLTDPLVIGLFITAAVTALPFQMIYLIYKFIKYRNEKKNSTYIATQGFQYYRNKLQNIHPMQISLLSNLKIEEEKDIKTMIMYYEHHNIIKVDGDKIEIIDDLNPLLKQSDRALLSSLANTEIKTNLKYYDWKQRVKQEAISAGLVKQKGIGSAILKIFFILFIASFITVLLIMASSVLISSSFKDGVEITTIQDLLSNIKLVIGLALILIFSLFDFALYFGGPIFIFVHFISTSFLERTTKGNEVTEQIHGLKRFIHDFSTLEDATKQELILWEDFLIYATILEENTQIIDEISVYKKL